MLSILAVSGYRSLRDLIIPLDRLNLVTGPNGSGKSNLYRALRLLAETAQGRVIPSLAREGGLQSTLWAGPETFSRAVLRGDHPVQGVVRKHPVSLRLGFAGNDFNYAIDLGLPPPPTEAFGHDPEIKRECIWTGATLRPSSVLVDRRGPLVKAREGKGGWTVVTSQLATFDTMMTHCADPRNTPEMLVLREEMRAWRFYDHFRTDAGAPARLPQIGTHTPILSHDGADLAAALQTIRQIGDGEAVDDAVNDAFPGAGVSVTYDGGWFGSRDATARAAPAIEGGGTVGRHAPLPAMGRCPADTPAAWIAGPQRAGNQPSSGSASRPGTPHCADGTTLSSRGRLSCAGAHRRPAAAAGVPFDHAGKEIRGNRPGRRRARHSRLALAVAVDGLAAGSPRRPAPSYGRFRRADAGSSCR
jgi:predicted ATPase